MYVCTKNTTLCWQVCVCICEICVCVHFVCKYYNYVFVSSPYTFMLNLWNASHVSVHVFRMHHSLVVYAGESRLCPDVVRIVASSSTQ